MSPLANDVEQSVLNVATENVTRHELGGRHVFQRSLREDFTQHLRLCQLIEETVLQHGVHLKGVAQALLLLGQTGQQSQLLVDEVGCQHRVCLLVGIGSGEIVVLASVDDNTCEAIDNAAEILVNQRALHVDVAEKNAVEGIVQHHIQALQGAHGGNLGHTQTGAIVTQADVAAYLLAHLVKRLAHDAEILLSGESAAEALGRSAIRHIVQQTLTRGADNGDDVSTLTGTGLSLHHILIDITSGNNDIQVGLAALANRGDILFTAFATATDTGDVFINKGCQGSLDLLSLVHWHLGDVQLAIADSLGNLLRASARFQNGVAHKEAHTLTQKALAFQLVHHHIGQGYLVSVDAVNT